MLLRYIEEKLLDALGIHRRVRLENFALTVVQINQFLIHGDRLLHACNKTKTQWETETTATESTSARSMVKLLVRKNFLCTSFQPKRKSKTWFVLCPKEDDVQFGREWVRQWAGRIHWSTKRSFQHILQRTASKSRAPISDKQHLSQSKKRCTCEQKRGRLDCCDKKYTSHLAGNCHAPFFQNKTADWGQSRFQARFVVVTKFIQSSFYGFVIPRERNQAFM